MQNYLELLQNIGSPLTDFFGVLFNQVSALWALTGDWTRLLLVLASLATLLLGCEWLRKYLNLPGELTRKIIHMLSGSMTCLFPWIFQSATPILILALAMSATFIAARYLKLFRSLFDIDRRSAGDIYFVLSVWILFQLTPDHRLYYVIPILTLTLADALAALLGKSYQKITYAVEQSFKSLEGSTVFFLVTFLCVHIPLLLFSDIGRIESLMIPLELAILVTCLESICLNGLDNLIIPLSVYYILSHPITDFHHTLLRLLTLGAIMTFVFIAGFRLRFLAFSASLVLQLFLYSLYAIHGFDWLIPAALAILIFGIAYFLMTNYLRLFLKRRVDTSTLSSGPKAYQVLPVFYIALIPTFIALCQDVCLRLECPLHSLIGMDLYPLFITTACLELSMALLGLLTKLLHLKRSDSLRAILLVTSISALSLAIPFLSSWTQCAGALLASLVACSLQLYLLNHPRWPIHFPWPWRIYAVCSALSLLIVWPLIIYLH